MAFVKREIFVKVEFSGENVFLDDDAPDVLAWYVEQLESLKESYLIDNIEITYEQGSIFKIVYEHSEDDDPDMLDELIADPDDDGNYPIRKGVLVMGYIEHF